MNIVTMDKLRAIGTERDERAITYNDIFRDEHETYLTSAAGVRVNSWTALMHHAVWRCVELISTDVARLPFGVFNVDTLNGGKVRNRNHPADYLISTKPNPYQTSFTFRKTMSAHRLTRGNGYAFIWRDDRGAPSMLQILDPDLTYPVIWNGERWYVTTVDGVQRRLDNDSVLHIMGPSYDGLEGLSVIGHARESIGLAMGQDQYAARYFSNSGRPPVYLTVSKRLDPQKERQLREDWERMYQGLDNAHRTAVLSGGVEAKEFSINAKDAQLIESREFDIPTIANWFGVPAHKLGGKSNTSYGSLEQENQSYLVETLDGHLVAWESECDAKLVTERASREGSVECRFDRSRIVSADLRARTEALRIATGGVGWMSVNEARAQQDLPALDDPEANTPYRPLNMDPVVEDPEAESDEEIVEADTTASAERSAESSELVRELGTMISDTTSRMLTRISGPGKRAMGDDVGFAAWVDRCRRKYEGLVRESLGSPVRAVAMVSGDDPDERLEGVVDAFFARMLAGFHRVAAVATDGRAEHMDAELGEMEHELAQAVHQAAGLE